MVIVYRKRNIVSGMDIITPLSSNEVISWFSPPNHKVYDVTNTLPTAVDDGNISNDSSWRTAIDGVPSLTEVTTTPLAEYLLTDYTSINDKY